MKRFTIINNLIKEFGYKSYLEIGTCKRSMCFNKINIHDNMKVCVDPDPKAKADHVLTSDEYFEQYATKFDIIFIDGMHEYQQVNKDIKNALSVLNDTGVIIIHDCNPLTKEAATPWNELDINSSRDINFTWNGDVYKAFIDYRHNHNTNQYLTFTIDSDHGCGIIFKIPNSNENKLNNIDMSTLSYETFSKDRDNLLRLVSPKQFKSLIKGNK